MAFARNPGSAWDRAREMLVAHRTRAAVEPAGGGVGGPSSTDLTHPGRKLKHSTLSCARI